MSLGVRMPHAYGYALSNQVSSLEPLQETCKVALNVSQGACGYTLRCRGTPFLNDLKQFVIKILLGCSKITCFVLVLLQS